MKKLELDRLTVDSFATSPAAPGVRGTVAAREMARTLSNCPESWNGTCWISCWDSCACETSFC